MIQLPWKAKLFAESYCHWHRTMDKLP